MSLHVLGKGMSYAARRRVGVDAYEPPTLLLWSPAEGGGDDESIHYLKKVNAARLAREKTEKKRNFKYVETR